MDTKFILASVFGFAVRAILLTPTFHGWLSRRIEIATPVSSWRRIVEGIDLLEHGNSPFQGDVFHQSPLLLSFFRGISHVPFAVNAFYMIVDILAAVAFYHIATLYQSFMLAREKKEQDAYASDVNVLLYQPTRNIGIVLAASYWLNPFVILSCAAQSTVSVMNFILSWTVLTALRGRTMATCLGLSLAIHHDPFLLVMVVPCALLLSKKSGSPRTSKLLVTVGMVTVLSGALLWLCYVQSGSWDFLRSTYGFVFSVPDLTPNVGIFWYLFTEMFDHFRTFFMWVMQLHVFFYVLPMAMRLQDHPFFLVYLMSHVVGVFKSYPALGDTALPLTLLVLWKHLFMYVRGFLVIAVMFLVSLALMPTFWYLWIVAGSGNANFFYAGTLAYNLAHVMLISGCTTAFLRREFALRHGIAPKLDGKPATVVLS